MRQYLTKLKSVDQTGAAMKALVKKYAMDMAPYASRPLMEVFDTVKMLPYIPDPKGVESLHRPLFTMQEWYPETGRDCDDKAVAIAAWAELNGIPWDFEIVGRGTKYHHVRAMMQLNGKWWTVDPTYPRNTLFRDSYFYPKRRRFDVRPYEAATRRLLAS
jgi:hypothetical protein